MNLSKGQGDLFTENYYSKQAVFLEDEVFFSKKVIEDWQQKIHSYQKPLHQQNVANVLQKTIPKLNYQKNTYETPNLLELTPLPLNFWRWPKGHHYGPAIYLVMDKLKELNSHIILYIGETIAAEKRWKGEHDCKKYLEAYSDACQKAGLTNQLSIRFWKDVPKETKNRRGLEQYLIQNWRPAFNKETRVFWNTPFTKLN